MRLGYFLSCEEYTPKEIVDRVNGFRTGRDDEKSIAK